MEKSEDLPVRKWETLSIIAFILSIVFSPIALLVIIPLFILSSYGGEISLYTVLFYLFIFIIPFGTVFILSILGYNKINKDNSLRGRGLAITALIISLFFIIATITLLVLESRK